MNELEQEGKLEKAAELTKDEIIPPFEKALNRFKSVDPANKRIKKMNDKQIERDEHFKKMIKDIVTYYEGGDVSEKDIKEFRKTLNEKQENVLDYRDKLMEEYDLEEVEDVEKAKRFPNIKRAE